MKVSREAAPVQASRLIPRNVFAELGMRPAKDQQSQCAQLIDLRLPGNLQNSIRVQPSSFNEQAYKVESNVNYKDEKGILNTKRCAVTNFIRWRYAPKTDAKAAQTLTTQEQAEFDRMEKQLGLAPSQAAPSQKMESNAKVVEWSDGTKSLVIGDQVFEIQSENVHRAECFAQYSKFFLLKGQVSSKMIVKPSLRSHVMRKQQSMAEDQVQLSLAVSAKEDLMYNIDQDQAAKASRKEAGRRKGVISYDSEDDLDGDEFEEGAGSDDDGPAAGAKRRFTQLQRKCEGGGTDEQGDDDNDESQSRVRSNQGKARAKRPRIESPAAGVKEGEPQAKSAASGARQAPTSNQAYESGSEDEYKPGQLFAPTAPADQSQADGTEKKEE